MKPVPTPAVDAAFTFIVPMREINEAFSRALSIGAPYGRSPLRDAVERALERKAADIEELMIRAVAETVADPEWRKRMQEMVNGAIYEGLKRRVESRIGSIGAAFIVKALAARDGGAR